MIGWDVLLGAALEAGLGLLAQAGLGDELADLKSRLTGKRAKARRAAFDRAFDAAVAEADGPRLKPLFSSSFFRKAVIAGLLDPVHGFDVQAVAEAWGEKLPAHALALRRFFSRLERALLADGTWGPLLDRYLELRFREDVLTALRERRLDLPAQELVSRLDARLIGSGVIAQDRSVVATGESMAIGGDVWGDVVKTLIEQIVVERLEVVVPPSGPQPGSLRAAYLNHVFETANPLSLAGVDPKAASDAQSRLDLSAVYTALLTLTPEECAQVEGGRWQEASLARLGRASGRVSALAQLDRCARLVLLGEPGSGKSTFVHFVAICLAGEALGRQDANLARLTEPLPVAEGEDEEDKEPQPQPWTHGALLPVRVVLRDFAARGLPGPGERATARHLWAFVVSQLESAALGDYAPHLDRELRDQGGLLLLDGLDEVPEAERRREQIKQAIEDLCAAFPRCRVLVTSRTYAYQQQAWRLPGFDEAVLAPFGEGQIRRFVDRWYAHVAQVRVMEADDAQGRAELLKRAILGSDRLRALAERPLLLTLMASLHAWRGGTLPEKREELYADTVDLLLDWWESPKIVRDAQGQVMVQQPSLAEWLKVDREKVRGLLNELAYRAHASQSSLVGTADVPEDWLVGGLLALSRSPDARPRRLIEFLSQRAGLLLPRGVGVYTFPHRTFQEYLAACYLTDHEYPEQVAGLARTQPDRWHEVALLAGAKAARGTASAIWSLVDALCYQKPGAGAQRPGDAWGALVAGQALVESADLDRVSERNRAKVDCVCAHLGRVLAEGRLPAVERVAAGNALARLGDPRLRADAWYLPDEPLLGFVEVPAGPFWMGSDKKRDLYAWDGELPQH
jgi:hypothetical protein